MRIHTIAVLVGAMTVTGCSGGLSALNPMNMFKTSEDVEMLTPLEARDRRRDPRPLMEQVTTLEIEPSPGGALIRVSGSAPTTGYYGVDLLEVNEGVPVGGILTYHFVAAPPPRDRAVTPGGQTLQVTAAKFVSEQVLAETREILVVAERNARSAKR
ncbi:MAG: hypothetical protein GKR99_19625 [Rhodobacteraceae bacterium]|nr:hypothetical protein [Paracoccaceae bacterium]